MSLHTRHLGTAALFLYALSMLLPAAELRYTPDSNPQTAVGFFLLGLSLVGAPMLYHGETMGYVCLLGVCCNVLFIAAYFYFILDRRPALSTFLALLAATGAVVVSQLNLSLIIWGFAPWLLSFGLLAIASAAQLLTQLRPEAVPSQAISA